MNVCCPRCNQLYDIDESFAGQKARCEKCGEKFIIEESAPNPDAKKTCPMCGETILAIAKKCRYCGSMLEGDKAVKSVDRVMFIVFAFLLGGLGAHNLYVGRTWAAVCNILITALALPTFGGSLTLNFLYIIWDICQDPNDPAVKEKWQKQEKTFFWMSIFFVIVFIALLCYPIVERYI